MEVDPTLAKAEVLFNRGLYEECHGLLAALDALRPGQPAVLRGLALASIRLGQPKRAFACYRRALEAAPDDAETRFALALFYLSRGNYPQGFLEYEWRMRRPGCLAGGYARGAELWDGRPLEGESLMLHCEQGLGDALQFIRFLPLVRQRARTIHLACHPGLVRLFAGLEGLAGIVTEGDPIPRCDFHCPLLSLPRVFGTTLETLPRRVPYLPVPALPARAIGDRGRPRVGLVWRARLDNAGGVYKSVPLPALLPLAEAPVDWISLQQAPDAAEREHLRDAFRAEIPVLHDFRETAEVVAGLDLVLSVDTSVLHLAGGLGRPVWALLPRWPDWRWMEDRSDSPWYPAATLFRQETDRDWSVPIQAVGRRLREGRPG